ncbi:MAG: CoA ester lyase [Betaproteobacteria bacterium]|nr:CoA ester lyase [Betaproteobacteria bacterium]
MPRSYMFVPGDSGKKLAKGLAGAADALIIDLEDAVAPSNKDAGRALTARFLEEQVQARPRLWVRVNAFATGLTEADLDAIVPRQPVGVVLPKCDGIEHVARLAQLLGALEARHGLPDGAIRIMGIVTETAASVLNLPSLRVGHPRLAAMMWGGEDLAADLAAASNRDATGAFSDPFRLARSMCLLAAKAAGAEAIDTVFTDIRDLARLEAETLAAREMGFDAKAAIHPDQIAVINRVYTPAEAELAWARRVVAAFDAQPGVGVVRIDDEMVDQPHLKHARRLLAAS